MNHKLWNIVSTERYILHMQVLLECCYIWMESSQWENWNNLFCRKVSFLTDTCVCLPWQKKKKSSNAKSTKMYTNWVIFSTSFCFKTATFLDEGLIMSPLYDSLDSKQLYILNLPWRYIWILVLNIQCGIAKEDFVYIHILVC